MENDIDLKAEKHTLIALAKALREAEVEGTLSDLAYQIEYEFDIDGVRSEDEEFDEDDEEYAPSAENGDYSPGNPWDAPGMSIHDFI
jgi:recombination DNA repair RAD52 pathway protein